MDAHSTTLTRPVMGTLEWKEAVRFDSTDWGWVIMSIGMAIGAGIVFLPVQVGLMGLWVFLLSAVIGYPAMYMFQRLFINTLATSPECKDYPSVISGYLGKNWGVLLGALYFVMLVIWVFATPPPSPMTAPPSCKASGSPSNCSPRIPSTAWC